MDKARQIKHDPFTDLTFIECLTENRPRIEIRAGTAVLNELGNAIRVTKVQTGSGEEEQWMRGRNGIGQEARLRITKYSISEGQSVYGT
jgi:hypothetical protein